ncbi:MAG TPA: cytochrome P450, partial [Acidimicrobiales bacterium]|nr:cytochrome P450 [Acidimicrobiales bacterium]
MDDVTTWLDDAVFATPESRRADPYPFYDRLRALPDGFGRSVDMGTWHTATHAHVRALLVDPRFTTNPAFATTTTRTVGADPASSSPARNQQDVLLFMDPPDHTRIRRLASMAFTPRAVARLEGDITRIAGELLDEIGVGPGSGAFDLVSGYARLLPLAVICQMFAIPDIDRTSFLRWSDDLAHALEPIEDPDEVEATIASYLEFAAYFTDLSAARRTDLGEDLLSALLVAEADGDRLSNDELRSLFTLLFIAGHETTGNLIGNAMLALLRNPEQLDLLRAEPARIPGAVDELLRYDSSVQLTARIAKEPIEIAGTDVRFEPGDEVICYLGGANRDPAEFGHDAHLLDVTRDARNHVAFGGGI